MEKRYIVNNNIVYGSYRDDLFDGYVPVNPPCVNMSPWLEYIGPKISWDLWHQVLAFFAWSYDESKSETQVRLYFNKDTWRAWAFPQEYGTGMTTKELPEFEGEERKKAGLGKGWIEGGTIHHHCGMSAFQSGTDRDNEKTKNGVHITVGNIDKTIHSIHGRLSFRQTFYDLDWTNWFQMPPGLEGLPVVFRSDVMKHFLTRAADPKTAFPKEWRENLIKKHWPAVAHHHNHHSSHPDNWHKDEKTGKWEKEGAGHGEVPFAKGGNNHAPASIKETRRQRREKLSEKWTEAYTQSVQECVKAAAYLAGCYNITMADLLIAAKFPQKAITTVEIMACEELEGLLKEAGVHFDDMDDWISIAWEHNMKKGGKDEAENKAKPK